MPPIYATDKGTKSTPAPEGTFVARCIQVIDVGSHQYPGGDDERVSRKVRISWELPTETHVFSEEKGPEPFVVSKEFTLSTNEKSTLRQTLESWRGKQFTPDEAKQFDVSALVGHVALVSIVHAQKRNSDGVYAKISSVTKPPKGMTCPSQVLPSVVYSVDEGRNATFQKLPEWLRKQIEGCEEWREYPVKHQASAPAEPEPEQAPEDDVPF